MTKEQILEYFNDINEVYNESSRYDDLKHMLDELPERQTGHWILQSDYNAKLYGWFYCSECGAYIGEQTNYCSECDAYRKMMPDTKSIIVRIAEQNGRK